MNTKPVFYLFFILLGQLVFSNTITRYYNLGNSYLSKHDYEKAIILYSKALAIAPYDIDARYNRGIAFYYTKQFDKAGTDFTVVIEAEPDNIFAWQSRAITYTTAGHYNKAITDYRKVLSLNKSFVYSDFGILYASYHLSPQLLRSNYRAFKKSTTEYTDRQWVTCLIQFIQQKFLRFKLLKNAGDDPSQLSEAYFAIGFKHLVYRRKRSAARYFKKCLEMNQIGNNEYFWAEKQLERIQ